MVCMCVCFIGTLLRCFPLLVRVQDFPFRPPLSPSTIPWSVSPFSVHVLSFSLPFSVHSLLFIDPGFYHFLKRNTLKNIYMKPLIRMKIHLTHTVRAVLQIALASILGHLYSLRRLLSCIYTRQPYGPPVRDQQLPRGRVYIHRPPVDSLL